MFEDWEAGFPYGDVREVQRKALDGAARAFDKDKPVVVLQAGTGVGKSAMAVALASTTEKTYILTTTNDLARQYKKDHGDVGKTIKGRRHYECVDRKVAAESPVLPQEDPIVPREQSCNPGGEDDEEEKEDKESSCNAYKRSMAYLKKFAENPQGVDPKMLACSYLRAKYEAIQAPVTFSNVMYYLVGIRNSEAWPVGELVVFDEADGIPNFLMEHVKLEITTKAVEQCGIDFQLPRQKVVDTELLKKDGSYSKLVEQSFMDEKMKELAKVLEKHLSWLSEQLEMLVLAPPSGLNSKDIQQLSSRLDRQARRSQTLLRKCVGYLSSRAQSVEWVCEVLVSLVWGKVTFSVLCRPLDMGHFAERLLLSRSEKTLFMSATMGTPEAFIREFGVRDAVWIDAPSPFDPKRRPIYYLNKLSMNHKTIEKNFEEAAGFIEKLMAARPDVKGIVHCGSGKWAERLAERLFSPRVILSKNGKSTAALDEHTHTGKPTFLLAANMSVGTNLNDDLGRVTVIFKVPFPNWGDAWVRRKGFIYPNWKYEEAGKTIEQQVGRAWRSSTDYSEAIIYDTAFSQVLKRYPFADNFVKAIKGIEEFEIAMQGPFNPN